MLITHKNPKSLNKALDEEGFASIAIALILILILALLTVGFAQLARREQQTALNEQLSNQAYYAAESAVNDAVAGIRGGTLTTATPRQGGTQCMNLPLPGASSADIDLQNGVSYTCVMVNLQPKSLNKDVSVDGDWSTYFSTVGGSPDTAVLSWSSFGFGNNPPCSVSICPAGNKFAPSGSWSARAVVQFSITPLNSLTRTDLINNTFTVYGYPSTATGSATYSTAAGNQGKVVDGNCTGTDCRIIVTGLPAGVTLYAIHAHVYYDKSHLVFTATSGGNALPLGGSQATIDATGRAREVLRRILVHVPLHNSADLPNEALEGQNICKYFTTRPNVAGDTSSGTQTAPLAGYSAAVTGACDVTH